MSIKVMMSIKPKYVDLILAGTKIFELRKKFPTGKKRVEEIYIYSSSPVKKVVAKAKVEFLHCSNHYPILWNNVTENGEKPENVGVTYEEFEEYFKKSKLAFGIKLKNLEIFDEPKSLKDFGINSAPQSWCYLNDC
ncbi:ASCH domain-containing protein [Cetobacterium sp.]|uniref:ASCH domain-containing protein n=1 Tax=Cetobacterium sp. TaxID=2071632 RepID=UPI003F328C16